MSPHEEATLNVAISKICLFKKTKMAPNYAITMYINLRTSLRGRERVRQDWHGNSGSLFDNPENLTKKQTKKPNNQKRRRSQRPQESEIVLWGEASPVIRQEADTRHMTWDYPADIYIWKWAPAATSPLCKYVFQRGADTQSQPLSIIEIYHRITPPPIWGPGVAPCYICFWESWVTWPLLKLLYEGYHSAFRYCCKTGQLWQKVSMDEWERWGCDFISKQICML